MNLNKFLEEKTKEILKEAETLNEEDKKVIIKHTEHGKVYFDIVEKIGQINNIAIEMTDDILEHPTIYGGLIVDINLITSIIRDLVYKDVKSITKNKRSNKIHDFAVYCNMYMEMMIEKEGKDD